MFEFIKVYKQNKKLKEENKGLLNEIRCLKIMHSKNIDMLEEMFRHKDRIIEDLHNEKIDSVNGNILNDLLVYIKDIAKSIRSK